MYFLNRSIAYNIVAEPFCMLLGIISKHTYLSTCVSVYIYKSCNAYICNKSVHENTYLYNVTNQC